MSPRRGDPERIHQAQRAGIFRRLVDEQRLDELDAEHWLARWERHAEAEGIAPRGHEHWDQAWEWIAEQRFASNQSNEGSRMSTVEVRFSDMLIDSADHATDDDHMVSVAHYELVVDGRSAGTHESLVHQPAGGSSTDPVEVTLPAGYDGPMDYQAFRDIVEAYYRSLVGPQGRAIRVGPGVTNLRMRNMAFAFPTAARFEVVKE